MRLLVAFIVSLFATLASAAPGDLDPTFGTGGKAFTTITPPGGAGLTGSGPSIINAMVVQPDGKIVAAGTVTDQGVVPIYREKRFAIARYLADGTLDSTFGSGGIVVIDQPGRLSVAWSMALQPDGMIVVGGETALTTNGVGGYGNAQHMLVRLQANGALDATFGTGGISILTPEYGAQALKVLADGRLITTGQYFVRRFLANGAADATFGSNGRIDALVPGGQGTQLYSHALALQSNGAIVAAGDWTHFPGPTTSIGVNRFNADGSFDTSFDADGKAQIDFPSAGSQASATLIQPDGRIVISGGCGRTTGPSLGPPPSTDFCVARLNGDGTPDTAFGTNGLASVDLGDAIERAAAMVLEPNGRIVLAGPASGGADFALLRYSSAGVLDVSFKGGGATTVNMGAAGGSANALVRLADGRFVIGGQADGRFALSAHVNAGLTVAVVPSKVISNLGDGVTLTASVFSDTPTGTATIKLDGNDFAGCVDMPLVNGVAICATSALPAGRHVLTMQYSGDADDAALASLPITLWILSATGDVDNDGVPDFVEGAEGLDPIVKDNDFYAAYPKGARLFAMQQYRDFLAREGDAAGLQFWTSFNPNGSAVVQAYIINSFVASPEFGGVVAPVTRLYFAYFLRIPDYDGLRFWIAQSSAGTPLATISNAFAGSAEFQARYGALDNAAFVSLVYQNVLGRPGDAGGLAFWKGQLDGGMMSRGAVMVGFSESDEYRASIANDVFVSMMYTGMLRRTPDNAGFASWIAYLDAGNPGFSMIQGFVGSTEYQKRFLP